MYLAVKMCLSVPGWLFHALNFQMGSFTDWPDECLEMLAHLKIRPSLEQLNWMIFSVLKFHLQRRWYLTKLARGTLDISNQLVIWKFAKSSKQLFKYCCVDYWKSLIQRIFFKRTILMMQKTIPYFHQVWKYCDFWFKDHPCICDTCLRVNYLEPGCIYFESGCNYFESGCIYFELGCNYCMATVGNPQRQASGYYRSAAREVR